MTDTLTPAEPATVAAAVEQRRSHPRPGRDVVGAAVSARTAARKSGNWVEADRLLLELQRTHGVRMRDLPDGSSTWEFLSAEPADAATPSAASRQKPAGSVRAARGRQHRAHRRAQKTRASAFADWLCATFPTELGSSGSASGSTMVLDVAGGRGGLCWELAVVSITSDMGVFVVLSVTRAC